MEVEKKNARIQSDMNEDKEVVVFVEKSNIIRHKIRELGEKAIGSKKWVEVKN